MNNETFGIFVYALKCQHLAPKLTAKYWRQHQCWQHGCFDVGGLEGFTKGESFGRLDCYGRLALWILRQKQAGGTWLHGGGTAVSHLTTV